MNGVAGVAKEGGITRLLRIRRVDYNPKRIDCQGSVRLRAGQTAPAPGQPRPNGTGPMARSFA